MKLRRWRQRWRMKFAHLRKEMEIGEIKYQDMRHYFSYQNVLKESYISECLSLASINNKFGWLVTATNIICLSSLALALRLLALNPNPILWELDEGVGGCTGQGPKDRCHHVYPKSFITSCCDGWPYCLYWIHWCASAHPAMSTTLHNIYI